MVKYKKKTTVQRETFERVRVLRRATNSSHFCSQCAAETEFLTLDQAVSLAKTGTRELMRRIDAQELHALETTSGHLRVCQNSLIESAKKNGARFDSILPTGEQSNHA